MISPPAVSEPECLAPNVSELANRLADEAASVLASDPHSQQRLALIDQLEEHLSAGELAEENPRLASQIEHWRYEILRNFGGNADPSTQRVTDLLALAIRLLLRLEGSTTRRTVEAVNAGDRAFLRWLDLCQEREGDCFARAAESTRSHFGSYCGANHHKIRLYAPLYLSNHCINYCVYCSFRYPEPIARRQLSLDEALREAAAIQQHGFQHILLVGGDFPSRTTPRYYADVCRALAAKGVAPAVEIAPQSTAGYQTLARAGACGVTLYQETYSRELYASYHPRGTKAAYDWRLEGLERAADAGIRRLGLGVLLGLADPREDVAALVAHARYLGERFPHCQIAVSLPRIHRGPASFRVPFPVDDATFVRLYAAVRLALPEAELVLSTREAPELRDRLARLCITQMSAGSCTAPGGYTERANAGEQFPVCDGRTPEEVARHLTADGFQVQWGL